MKKSLIVAIIILAVVLIGNIVYIIICNRPIDDNRKCLLIEEYFNEQNINLSQVDSFTFDENGTVLTYHLSEEYRNQLFLLAYEGKQHGSNVRSLISKIATYNATEDSNRQLEFNDAGKILPENLNEVRSAIAVGKSYTVTFKYDESGLIDTVYAEPID